MNSGKLVTLSVLALAVGLAGYAWTYHRGRSNQAVGYWGAENAVLLRTAPQVALARLVNFPDDAVDSLRASSGKLAPEVVTIDERQWQVLDERDITDARGLVHLRQALVQNSSFDWSPDKRVGDGGQWDYLLRFRDVEQRSKSLDAAIGISSKQLQRLDRRTTIGLRIADGLEAFFAEQLR